MAIAPTGQRIKIPYSELLCVDNGKIAEKRVSVKVAAIRALLGPDTLNGHGWDLLDCKPPKNASLSFA